ncbi:MAG: alpha/beta hydrolase [Planctomycetes bacterium]|nr:alpha/beta hydrolase [Planctomycetota bacterium]
MIYRLVVTASATYVAVCILVAIFQTHLIYFPSRDVHTTPADIGMDFEDVTLRTSDGLSIAAWYVPRSEAKATVLYCHGNAGNIADLLVTIQQLHQLGYNVLVFDYHGFGQSEGRPSERGTYLDAEAAWAYLVETRAEPPARIVVFGHSLGGAVAIELAARHEPAALVAESTFTSLADVAATHHPLLPVRVMLVHRYESIAKIARVKCPKLFLHGGSDWLIPIAQGRTLYDTASSPKEFIETPGGHNTSGFTYSPEYSEKVAGFIDEALTGSRP